jgi:hypothetical protein
MNKLEKVALRCARRTGRPLVLVINNVHFFKNDDEGRMMLLQLQQRAEAWAASGVLLTYFCVGDGGIDWFLAGGEGILTFVFSSYVCSFLNSMVMVDGLV